MASLRASSASYGRTRSPAQQPSNLRASSLNPDLLYNGASALAPSASWQGGVAAPPGSRASPGGRASVDSRFGAGGGGGFEAGGPNAGNDLRGLVQQTSGYGPPSTFTSLPQVRPNLHRFTQPSVPVQRALATQHIPWYFTSRP